MKNEAMVIVSPWSRHLISCQMS